MQAPWTKITDPTDALYSAENPYYESPWYGNEAIPEIGPSGETDGFLHWTFAVDTSADPAHMPGGRRYVCRRRDASWAPHV